MGVINNNPDQKWHTVALEARSPEKLATLIDKELNKFSDSIEEIRCVYDSDRHMFVAFVTTITVVG